MLKEGDILLVRGGKLPTEALRWLTEVEKYFPGSTKDIVIVRQKPISSLARDGEKGIATERARVKTHDHTSSD